MEEFITIEKGMSNTNCDIKKCQIFVTEVFFKCSKILEEEEISCLIHKDICEKCNGDNNNLLHHLKIAHLEAQITNGFVEDDVIIKRLKRLEELKGGKKETKKTFLKMARNGVYLKEELIDLAKNMDLDKD